LREGLPAKNAVKERGGKLIVIDARQRASSIAGVRAMQGTTQSSSQPPFITATNTDQLPGVTVMG
jgi:hypothetical protein